VRIRALDGRAAPARLRLLRAVTILLALTLAALLIVADLDLALNDMDAQAANILLSSGNAGKGRLRTPYEKAVGFCGDARRGIGHDLRTPAAQDDRTDEKTVESLTDDFAVTGINRHHFDASVRAGRSGLATELPLG